jgi:hypothetical protein
LKEHKFASRGIDNSIANLGQMIYRIKNDRFKEHGHIHKRRNGNATKSRIRVESEFKDGLGGDTASAKTDQRWERSSN